MANIPIEIIIFVLFAHWFSDFRLQTNAMAQGKSESNYWLTMHVWTYFLGFATIGLILNILNIIPMTIVLMLIWIVLNCILHWITDYYTSRASSRLWAEKKIHDFFVCVGFDQMIHYATWFLTYLILT